MGDAAADSLLEERTANDPFKSIFDFVKRINLRTVNKGSMEALAQGGAFDSFVEMHRAQFFAKESTEDSTFLEKLIRFGGSFQAMQLSAQQSLFGDLGPVEIPDLKLPDCQLWSNLEKLKREKAVASFFISGHPLDDYRYEISSFCNAPIKALKANMANYQGKEAIVAGIISKVRHETAKNGNQYGRFMLEDFDETMELALFKEDYLKYKHLLNEDTVVMIRLQIASRYNDPNQLEPRIQRISLLAETMDEMAKTLFVYIHADALTEIVTSQLIEVIKKNKGNCKVRIEIIDTSNNFRVETLAHQHKVLCSAVIRQLQALPGIGIRIKG